MQEHSVTEIIDRLLDLYDEPQSISVSNADVRAALLGHGWYVSVRQAVRATACLAANGYSHETAPLMRSMIEHAIALHWLAESSDAAVDSLLRDYQYRVRKLRERVGSEWSIPVNIWDAILNVEIDKSAEDCFVAFGHQCERFGQGSLYVAWLEETKYCHPSFAGAAAYFEVPDGGNVGDASLYLQSAKASADVWSQVSLVLLLASRGFHNLLRERPWAKELEILECQLTRLLRRA